MIKTKHGTRTRNNSGQRYDTDAQNATAMADNLVENITNPANDVLKAAVAGIVMNFARAFVQAQQTRLENMNDLQETPEKQQARKYLQIANNPQMIQAVIHSPKGEQSLRELSNILMQILNKLEIPIERAANLLLHVVTTLCSDGYNIVKSLILDIPPIQWLYSAIVIFTRVLNIMKTGVTAVDSGSKIYNDINNTVSEHMPNITNHVNNMSMLLANEVRKQQPQQQKQTLLLKHKGGSRRRSSNGGTKRASGKSNSNNSAFVVEPLLFSVSSSSLLSSLSTSQH